MRNCSRCSPVFLCAKSIPEERKKEQDDAARLRKELIELRAIQVAQLKAEGKGEQVQISKSDINLATRPICALSTFHSQQVRVPRGGKGWINGLRKSACTAGQHTIKSA